MKTEAKAGRRPAIHMIEAEAEKLTNLAIAVEERLPQVSELLLREIGRAKVHAGDDLPADVVTMGSEVEFVDEGNGVTRKVRLVYPQEADIAAGRVSILTPVGAGLIGLRAGQAILWPDREGRERALRIVKVERAG